MNFELGNDNSVVLLQSEPLDGRTSKVKCTKSAVDARLYTIVEAHGTIGKENADAHVKIDLAKKHVIESVISKQLEPKISQATPEVDDDEYSDCDSSPSMVADDLAVEHHVGASQIHATSQNSGSIPSAGSFASDDSLRDPSSGSFYCDYAETIQVPCNKQIMTKPGISSSNKQEPTLEDLMSIMEFECDPDFIDDAPYSEGFHVMPSTQSFSIDSYRGNGRNNHQSHGSSSEFFPNSSIELAKSYANDEKLRSGSGRGHGGNGEKSNDKGTPVCTERKRKMSEVLGDETCTPNRPHPALEFPILYFLLRRCQWLFDKIKIPYAYRWGLSYPLQQNVPIGTTLSKMGIYCTWGELLLLVPFFVGIAICMMYTVVTPSVSMTGTVARYGLISTLVFAQRNSLVTLLLGMPCDRGVFYHKLSGRVAGIASVLHTASFFLDPKFQRIYGNDFCYGAFTGTVNISGSVMMIIVVAICISAMSRIRRRMYEVFYCLHVLFSVGLVAGALYHSGLVVPIVAAATWGVDLFIRSIVMARTRYPRKATLKLVSDSVIELSFPKTTAFAYNPGQYVHIAIPEISWLQWHPFSISSSPKQRVVTLHIRLAGNWTKQLFELYKKQTEVSMLMEGPYGNLSVDLLTDRKYKNVMLISGGIGSKLYILFFIERCITCLILTRVPFIAAVTPMQSICEQLLYEKVKKRRTIHNLKFIWMERDPQLMQESTFVKRTSSIGSVGSLNHDDLLSLGGSNSFDFDDVAFEEGPIDFDTSLELFESTLDNDVKLARILDGEACMDIIGQLLSVLPPSTTTDDELEALFQSGEFDCNMDGDSGAFQDCHDQESGGMSIEMKEVKKKRRPSFVVEEETSFADNDHCWLTEASKAHDDRTVVSEVFVDLMQAVDMQIYLTSQTQQLFPMSHQIPNARYGRPDIKKIFLDMKQAALDSGEKYVAVCVCAPKAVTDKCRVACQRYSDARVQFDFHTEVMTF